MTRLEQIEKSVEQLSDEELKAFEAWLAELRWQRWDCQLQADVKAGRLDKVFDEVRAEIAAGKTTPL